MRLTSLEGDKTVFESRQVARSGWAAKPRWIRWAIAAPLLLELLLLAAGAARLLRSKADNTYPESALLYTAAEFARTGVLYRDVAQAPFTPVPYGPLTYLTLAGLAMLSGNGLMLGARGVVLLSAVGIAALAYLILRRLGASRNWGLLGAALVLTQPNLLPWAVSARPDLPAILLSLAGLYLYLVDPERTRGVILAGICAASAVLLKQTYITLPLTMLIFFLNGGRYKQLLRFAAAAMATVSVPIAVLYRLEPQMRQMISNYAGALSDPYGMAAILVNEITSPRGGALLALGALGFWRCWWRSEDRPLLLALYGLFSWLLGLLGLLQIGGDRNYLLEPWTVTAMLAALGARRLWAGRMRLQPAAAGLMAIVLAWFVFADLNAWRQQYLRVGPAVERAPLLAALHGHSVLADSADYTLAGTRPEMLDPFLNHCLERVGRWSPKPIVDRLRSRAYDYIVTRGEGARFRGFTMFGQPIQSAIAQNYRFYCGTDETWVWVPAGANVSEAQKQALRQGGCHTP